MNSMQKVTPAYIRMGGVVFWWFGDYSYERYREQLLIMMADEIGIKLGKWCWPSYEWSVYRCE